MMMRRVVMMFAALIAVGAVAASAYRLIIATPLDAPMATDGSQPPSLPSSVSIEPAPEPLSKPHSPEDGSTPALTDEADISKGMSEASVTPAYDMMPMSALRGRESIAQETQQLSGQDDADNPMIRLPSFDGVRIEQGRGIIAGQSTPSSNIVITDHENDVTHITVDNTGHFELSLPLDAGEHVLSLREEIKDLSITSQQSVTLLIAPDRMPLTSQDKTTDVVRAPALLPDHPDAPLRIDMVEMNEKGDVSVRGHGLPDQDVTLYVDQSEAHKAHVAPDRSWIISLDHSLPHGTHDLRVDLTTQGQDDVIARVQVPFTAPDINAAPLLIVRRGDSLWRISRKNLGRGIRYTEIFALNQDQIRDPNLIYPGQRLNMPNSANP